MLMYNIYIIKYNLISPKSVLTKRKVSFENTSFKFNSEKTGHTSLDVIQGRCLGIDIFFGILYMLIIKRYDNKNYILKFYLNVRWLICIK